MMGEHTPAPWKWCGNDIEAEDYTQGDVMSPTVNCGPFCYGGMVELGITESNARHIVHCVNNYERLVEMLYEAEGHLRTLGYHYSNKVLHEKADKIESLLLELEAEKGGEL